ncbi:MAG: murein biosynthesis integral membrane protein MurJ [Patescibacteria group bacterium]|jgi:putative peptidoglycan lipid II flippase
MFKEIWRKFAISITGGAIIIGSASVISRFVGLMRDNLFAKYFGASATLDAYNAAFKVPDLIFNILVLGALSASFIPVYLEVMHNKNKEEANRVANSVLNFLLIGLTALVIVAYFLSPVISEKILMATRSVEQQQLTASLMRIMLVSIIFFGISNVFSGILNSYRRFMAYSLAPICYNIGIIFGIVYLSRIYGNIGLAYGVVIGAACHFLVQLPAVWRVGFRYAPIFNFSLAGTKQILKLMPSRSLALGIVQINALIIAALALRLEEGSLAIWTWADNLQHFPINVFGVSLAISAFPVFSSALACHDMKQFKQYFSESFRKVLFFIIPISIITLLLRAQIVRLILGSFGGGKFDWDATILTAQTLGFFSISMFAQACIPMLARSFFAQKNTKTPVIISLISMIINAALAWWLSQFMGVYGLALAFSISSLINMLMLLVCLRVQCGDLDDQRIINSVWKIILASLVMGLVIHGVKYAVAPLVDMHTFVGIFLQTVLSMAAGASVYLFIAYYFKFSEVEIVREFMGKAKKLFTNGKQT